jgi:predicted dehydrogenase
MAKDPKVDAIWITVPNYARIPVVKAITEEVTQGRAELVGLACEKPLGRNVKEARLMLDMVEKASMLHGYLENQVFMPSLVKGKEILWKRGANIAGRPYLARCSHVKVEEH